MQTIVIVLNVILAIGGLWLAWRLRQLQRALKRTTQALILTEMTVQHTLQLLPPKIIQGQMTVQQGQLFLLQLDLAIRQAQQIWILLKPGRLILLLLWRRPLARGGLVRYFLGG
ncbi:hypothetical protein [Lyngbya confervoides]|uniref:Histidine kinase n=1 Tax=Lyngbya confervoides BDU141951 TaxID=1574623 RepID=A0ABD4T250_9CYAN|nr:hypothetical protein [Lyngbya confervoides]MCM1982466.1 hypothetical protein [Lyngbya confervoides BDU141951]